MTRADTRAPVAPPHQSLARGLAVLEYVGRSSVGVTITEISHALDLYPSTASRLVSSLEQLGYVVRREDRKVVMTSKVAQFAENAGLHAELKWLAQPEIQRLCARVNELVILSVRYGTYMLYVGQAEPRRSIRVASQVGHVAPLHDTAMGRSILVSLPQEEQMELLRSLEREPIEAPGLELRPERFARLRSEYTKQGYITVNADDNLSRAAGAPIFDSRGIPIAAIGVYGPAYRMASKLDHIGTLCRLSANRVSQVLSGVYSENSGN